MKKGVLVLAAVAYLVLTTGGAVSCEAAGTRATETRQVREELGAQLLTGNSKMLTGLPAGEVVLLGFAQQEDSESGAEHYGFGSSGAQVEAGEVEEVPEEVEEPAPEQVPSKVKPSPKQEPAEELESEREPQQTPKHGTKPYKQPEAEVPEDLNEHYAEV